MNVFDLWAKLSLDSKDYDEGLDKEKEKTESFGSKLGSVLGGVGKVVGTATIAAVSAAGVAVTGIVKQAIDSYADYEQLVGGSKLVFGEAYDYIMDKSVEAYKNVQLSQSEYLRQVNGFAVGLRESLGGNEKAAAELADRIVTAEADVVAAMGISQEAAQNAFNGIMKGNFTMVDNLMLGIKPTKEGFQEMIDKVNEWNATQGKATAYTIENIADMQAALVDYIEMQGLSGYAAGEAATTISGSLSMVKAAWGDVLISISGGGKGMQQAIEDLVSSIEGFAHKIMPVIEEALYGVGDLIQGIVPIIADRLPALLAQLVPMFLETAIYLVNSLVDSLPMLVETIASAFIDILPQLVNAAVNLLDSLLSSIIPILFEVAIQLVLAIGQGIADNVQQLTSSVISLILFLVQTIIEHLPEIIMVGLEILNGLIEGVLNNLHLITDAVVILITTFVETIFEHLPDILKAAIEIGLKIVAGIVLAIPSLIVSVGRMLGIVQSTKDQVEDHSQKMQNSVNDSTTGITSSIDSMIDNLNNKTNQARGMLSDTSSATENVSDNMNKKADDMVKTSQNAEKAVKLTINNMVNSVVFARASFQQSFEDMTKWLESFRLKMEELGKVVAMPRVDPSGVVAGCTAIVDACNRAINALRNLGSAQGSSGGFGGGRASGGWITSGTTYLVGEKGPELITATSNAFVHNSEETAGILGGGNRGINITIQGDVYDDAESMKNKLKRAVLEVIDTELSYA